MVSDDEIFEDDVDGSRAYSWPRLPIFFRRRSYLELILMVTSVSLALMFIIFLALFAANHGTKPSRKNALSKNSSVSLVERESKLSYGCVTKECLESATEMIYDIDSGVDPCQNFYQRSCGNWALRHPLYLSQGQINARRLQEYNNMERLMQLLRSPIKRYGPHSYERKTKHLFQSCYSGYGETPILPSTFDVQHLFSNMLVDTFPNGVFIFGDELNETTWDLQTELKRVRGDFWTDVLFGVYVQLDAKDTHKRILNNKMNVYVGELGLFMFSET